MIKIVNSIFYNKYVSLNGINNVSYKFTYDVMWIKIFVVNGNKWKKKVNFKPKNMNFAFECEKNIDNSLRYALVK